MGFDNGIDRKDKCTIQNVSGFHKAICKETNEEWIVYSLRYSGYPKPELTTVNVLLNDNSGYKSKLIDEVELYYCN